MSETSSPHDLATVIDPLKEFITWKWVGVVLATIILLFTEFVCFCALVVFGHYILAIVAVLCFVATLVIFVWYALTPQRLEENLDGFYFNNGVKKGIHTFSKFSPRVKKWVIQNFTGIVDFDEETGLCKEKCNKELN